MQLPHVPSSPHCYAARRDSVQLRFPGPFPIPAQPEAEAFFKSLDVSLTHVAADVPAAMEHVKSVLAA
jgi:hypothetical protein